MKSIHRLHKYWYPTVFGETEQLNPLAETTNMVTASMVVGKVLYTPVAIWALPKPEDEMMIPCVILAPPLLLLDVLSEFLAIAGS